MSNKEILLGSIPTINGIMDKQGYRVYSINGISLTIMSNSGGLGRFAGLYLVPANKNRIS